MDLNFLYEHLAKEGLFTKEAIEKELQGWEIIPAYGLNDEQIGVVLAKGSEVHLCARPEFYKRCLSRRNAVKILWPIFDRIGFLTTRIRLKSFSRQRFVEKAGFKKTWSDERFVYYMMTEKPYAKRPVAA